MPRTGGPRPYLVRVDRHAPTAKVRGAFTLRVSDPDTAPGQAAEILGAAFGLSRQSAELVATLVVGGDSADVAATAGVSRNTVKYHLQVAFAATGTARQADFVSRAVGVLRDLGVAGTA